MTKQNLKTVLSPMKRFRAEVVNSATPCEYYPTLINVSLDLPLEFFHLAKITPSRFFILHPCMTASSER